MALSGLRPDCLGTVRATVLQKARALERETHGLACVELPVARHLDAGEMDETATWHLRSVDHVPAFVSVELPCLPQPEAARKVLRGSRCEEVADHLCLIARRFRSSRSGLETPVQLANASLGVLLGQPLGLVQCKEPSRVRVERNERKQLCWALIREVPAPR